MGEETKLKIEVAAAGFLAAVWLVRYIESSQRLAVARDRRERQELDQRMADVDEEINRREEEGRERFRDDVAAGVKAALRED